MKQDTVEDFFHSASQAMPVAIIILVVALFAIRYDVFKSSNQSIHPSLTPSITPVLKSVAPLNSLQLNPSQPFVCSYIGKEASVSAYRKENTFFAQNKIAESTSFYLIQGNCFYTWKQSVSIGQKICGIGQYVNVANMLLSSGIGDISTLMNFIPKEISTASQSAVPLAMFKEVIKTCKNNEIKEKKIFEVPVNIKFVEVKK